MSREGSEDRTRLVQGAEERRSRQVYYFEHIIGNLRRNNGRIRRQCPNDISFTYQTLIQQCDSKRPKCGSCVVAGVPCNQEDRHRQTTISRDHTERLEQLVSQCDALLKRHVRGFSLQTIDDICAREGIDISDLQPIQNIPAQTSSSQLTTVQQVPSQPAYVSHPPPAGVPYYQYPTYIHPPPFQIPPIPPPNQAQSATTILGQDPKANDMSSTQALAKSFGVAPFIVNDTSTSPVLSYYTPTTVHYNTSNPPPATTARLAEEDLAVGSSGLDSGRDRVVQLEMPAPRSDNSFVYCQC